MEKVDEHNWQKRTLKSPTFCEFCSKLIGTISCVQCRGSCARTVHTACSIVLGIQQLPCSQVQTGSVHSMIDKTFGKPTWCNICRQILHGVRRQGQQCTTCHFVAHRKCFKKAEESSLLTCRPTHSAAEEQVAHHWVEGNVRFPKTATMSKTCIVCNSSIGIPACLVDFHCAWCASLCHSTCLSKAETCDGLGILGDLIVSPRLVNEEGQLLPDNSFAKRPLVCFVNSRSGGGQGAKIMHKLQNCLNPVQVFDLGADGGPERGLNIFHDAYPHGFQVLLCGGDGTINWGLETLRKLDWPVEERPPIAVLALGTGNDTSRVLGWGPGYDNEPIRAILEQVLTAEPVQMDRWQLQIASTEQPVEQRVFNNYFSIGIDAHILTGFHERREASPHLFPSRSVNKLWYGYESAKALNKTALDQVRLWIDPEEDEELDDAEKETRKMASMVDLQKDGIDGILIVNVPSYAAGTDIWQQDPPQSFSDGIIEVVGITSVTHMARVVAGTSYTISLGRGRRIRLELAATNSVQIDGEPWQQGPATIDITCIGQATMLRCIDADEDAAEALN